MMLFNLFSCATLLAAVSANDNGEAGTDVDCCHPDARAAIEAAGSRCGPVNADGIPVNTDDLDGSENMQCLVCWDVETNSIDATRPGCSGATDAQGEPCADGYCGGFAAANAHCFEAQCDEDGGHGGDEHGCPATCMTEQAQWCGRECMPCATNPFGTTTSGDACTACIVCVEYQQCAICGRGDDGEDVLNSLDIDAIIDTIVTNGDGVDAAFGDVSQLLDVPEIAEAFADGGAIDTSSIYEYHDAPVFGILTFIVLSFFFTLLVSSLVTGCRKEIALEDAADGAGTSAV